MNEIKMEKMTEMEALCEAVVLELIEIKHHLCNGRELEGGVGLGGLINSLLYRKDREEEKRNEEVQDEECDEECEEGSEEEDYKAMYIEKSEEFLEQREDLIDFREENKILKLLKKQSFELLQDLYNNDQIHPNHREQVRQLLLKTDEFVDGMLGRITSKS